MIPLSIVSFFHPPGTRLFSIRNDINLKIEETRLASRSVPSEGKTTVTPGTSQPTALHTLLTSSLPLPELQPPRLEDEAFTLLGAGTITTAHTLTTLLYYILANPSIKQSLETEISNLHTNLPADQPRPSLVDMEHAPYL